MLPDFTLPITLAGCPRLLIARDVPAAVFFEGFPNAVPLTECWRAESPEGQRQITIALARWSGELLTRVVVAPMLSRDLVRRLGPEGERAAAAYLTMTGFLAPADGQVVPSAARAVIADIRAPRAVSPVAAPPPNLRTALRLMAARARVLPSTLWQLPISDWIFNWRILCQDELLRRDGAAAAGPFTNDPALLGAA